MSLASGLEIAVLVPAFNEAVTIGKVAADFRAALPGATIYVYDNQSTDETAALAVAAGATVRREPRPGKGNVVRRMFQDVEADIYVMVDGDDTYDASAAPSLVEQLVADELDMVVGRRIAIDERTYRPGHRFGNRVLTGLVGWLFGAPIADMLSGYRVFSRRFVKSFPSSSREFEIETELTVHALQMRMAIAEVDTRYKERPSGSTSKLRTFRDGSRILTTILNLVRNERPLLFFTILAGGCALTALALGLPVFMEFLDTGLVRRFPTAILCIGLGILSVVCVATGLTLDLVAHVRRETRQLVFLQHPAPRSARAARPKGEPPAPGIP